MLLPSVLAPFSGAHAEVLKAADENNFVSFYAVPLSPIEGERVSWLMGFVENFSIANRSLHAKYSVAELSSEKVLSETDFSEVKSGVAQHSQVFEKPGIYELRVDYYYNPQPEKILSVDFQVQVREKAATAALAVKELALVFIAGLAIGGAAAHFFSRGGQMAGLRKS